jgi:hypothetical protein
VVEAVVMKARVLTVVLVEAAVAVLIWLLELLAVFQAPPLLRHKETAVVEDI